MLCLYFFYYFILINVLINAKQVRGIATFFNSSTQKNDKLLRMQRALIPHLIAARTKSLQGLGLGVKENAPDQGRDDTDLLRAEVKL
jgi:hypothetical protein